MREAIRRAMREYFNGRTYLGAGQYAVTERASQERTQGCLDALLPLTRNPNQE
jgi:hypothetical protein